MRCAARSCSRPSSSTSRTRPSRRVSRTTKSNGALSSSSLSRSTGFSRFIETVARPPENRFTLISDAPSIPAAASSNSGQLREVVERPDLDLHLSREDAALTPARYRPAAASSSIPRRARATSASSETRAPSSSRSFDSSVTRSAICTASSSAFIRIRVACRRACP